MMGGGAMVRRCKQFQDGRSVLRGHVRFVVASSDGALVGLFGGEPSNLVQPTRKGWTARLDGRKAKCGKGWRVIRPTSQPDSAISHVWVRAGECGRAYARTPAQEFIVGRVRRLDKANADKAFSRPTFPANLERSM